MFVRFARGAESGEYNDSSLFLGLVKTWVLAQERRKRGVGMQNFTYPPELDRFSHAIDALDPRVYNFLSKTFQLRSHRSLQYVRPFLLHSLRQFGRLTDCFRIQRAKMPRFPMVLEERVLHLILEYIQAGGYDGPVSMAWDDTKLHATLRAYWDPLLKSHFLVGHAGRPIPLANAEELEEILHSKSKEPGSKVRS